MCDCCDTKKDLAKLFATVSSAQRRLEEQQEKIRELEEKVYYVRKTLNQRIPTVEIPSRQDVVVRIMKRKVQDTLAILEEEWQFLHASCEKNPSLYLVGAQSHLCDAMEALRKIL